MPIPEPAGDLWPLVKAQSGWPEADEDQMRTMGAGWRGQGDAFVRTGGFDLGEIRGAWLDEAGAAYDRRAVGNLGTAARTGSDMIELGRRTDAYAEQVSGVKNAINDLIAQNTETYRTLDPVVKGRFVREVAVMVNELMQQGAGNVASIGGAPLGRAEPPPPGTSPQDVRQWWETVPARSRQTLIAENPDAIRNLDGIPAEVRDQANRAVIDREITGLQDERAQLEAKIDDYKGPSANHDVSARREIEAIDGKIAGLERLQAPGHLVLGFDTADDGKAIVAVGNPDTAQNVSTYVPGTFADLANIGGDIDRVGRLREAAGASNTAVIAWVGYDAPDYVLPNAAFPGYADDGAEDLAQFQDGLRATHEEGRAHQSVIGHSYGTVVIGHAARDFGLNVDSVGLVASPGIGVERVSELKLDGVPQSEVGQRVWALTGPDDDIRDSHLKYPSDDPFLPNEHVHIGHGHDPTEPDFGAQRIHTANLSADNHGGYFDRLPTGGLNPTLYSLGNVVIANRPDIQ